MPFILNSRDGRLFLNGETMDQVPPFLECPVGISEGTLAMEASKKNILTICDHILYRFMRSGGIFHNDSKWLKNTSIGVVKKYGNLDADGDIDIFKDDPEYKFPNKVTRGWCYLVSGALHRFFYRDFDLFNNQNPLINGDYHWWLQDKEKNIIDLTEEQYILNDIYNCRLNGVKSKPLGSLYSIKTRDLAFTIVNDLCREGVDIKKILISNYQIKL